MKWFFIALSAHMLWSLVNLADKYLVARFKEKDAGITILVMFMAGCALVSGIVITAFNIPIVAMLTVKSLILLVIAGVLHVIGIWWYCNAMIHDDAAHVASWFLLIPVFSYFGGIIFLGEYLSLQQIVGVVVIIVGALVFSARYQHDNGSYHVSKKMIWSMVVTGICLSLSAVIFKMAVPETDMFWGTIGVTQLGQGIAGLVLFAIVRYRREFIRMLSDQGAKLFVINIFGEVATIAGNTLMFLAILYAPVAVVSGMEGFQSFIVYLMTIPLAIIAPNYFTFDTSPRHIVLKIIGGVGLIVGTYLLLI